MSQLLDKDLKDYLKSLQDVTKKYNNMERAYKEQCDINNHLKPLLKLSKDDDKKRSQQLDSLRKICNNQEKTIADLQSFEKTNASLVKENASLLNTIQLLKQKIIEHENENKKLLQKQKTAQQEELQRNKLQLDRQAQEFQDCLEAKQATTDFQINELKNEIRSLTSSYEEKLKRSYNTEQNLQAQLIRQTNQTSTNIAVFKKKILELEHQVKNYKKEKEIYTASKGNFVSAQSVLNAYSNSSQVNRNNNNVPSNLSTSSFISNKETSFSNDKYLNTNKSNDNSIKRFHFKRTANKNFPENRPNISEIKNQNFENNTDIAVEQPNPTYNLNDSQNSQRSYSIDLKKYSNSDLNRSFQKIPKPIEQMNKSFRSINIDETEPDDDYETNPCDNNKIIQISNVNKSKIGFCGKKRKLFDPNNLEYLD